MEESTNSTSKEKDEKEKTTRESTKDSKETIDIEKQGQNKIDAIDICQSVASIEPSVVVQTNDITRDLDYRYGCSWLSKKNVTLMLLPYCHREKINSITSLFTNTNHIKREKVHFYYLKYKDLNILCNTGQWLKCDLINAMMEVFNLKAKINNYHNDYYFHNTYRYNYVTKPGYGKVNSVEDENRAFQYPDGKDFRNYKKLFIPINQGDDHWTLGVIDIEHHYIFHYNSRVDVPKDTEVMRNLDEKLLVYEYESCNLKKSDDEVWMTVMTHEMDINTVPQQGQKSGDCGLFIILFIERLYQGYEISTVTQKYIIQNQLRQKLAYFLVTLPKKFINECLESTKALKDDLSSNKSQEQDKTTTAIDNDVVMEDVAEDKSEQVSIEDDTTAGTSLVEFSLYYPSEDILKDPVLFQEDQQFDDLSDTDESVNECTIKYYDDDELKKTSDNNPTQLLSLENKSRSGVVFDTKKAFDAYSPKFYLRPDSIDWSKKKQQAVEYALSYEYDPDTVTDFVSEEDLLKVLKEIVYNPVWDSGFRIGDYDKLHQNYCYCPLSNLFDRCHILFGTNKIIGQWFCDSKKCKEITPYDLHYHCRWRKDHLHSAVRVYLDKLYGDIWDDDVGHVALYIEDSALQDKEYVSNYLSNKCKGVFKNSIVTTTRKYTREQKEKRLGILEPNPKQKPLHLHKTITLNILYAKQKNERNIRKARRKELGIFQAKKSLSIVTKVPEGEISITDHDLISPLSIQTDLVAKHQLRKSDRSVARSSGSRSTTSKKRSKEGSRASPKKQRDKKLISDKAKRDRDARKKREHYLNRKYKEELKEKVDKLKDIDERINLMSALTLQKKEQLLQIANKLELDQKVQNEMENSTFLLKKNLESTRSGNLFSVFHRIRQSSEAQVDQSGQEEVKDTQSSTSAKRKHLEDSDSEFTQSVKSAKLSTSSTTTKPTETIDSSKKSISTDDKSQPTKKVISKTTKKRQRREKQLQSKTIFDILVKSSIVSPDIRLTTLRLKCINRQLLYYGSIRQCSMIEETMDINSANEDNVQWNIWINGTACHCIFLSTKELKEAIRINGRENLPYETVVYSTLDKNKMSPSAYSCLSQKKKVIKVVPVISLSDDSMTTSSLSSIDTHQSRFKKVEVHIKCSICERSIPTSHFMSRVHKLTNKKIYSLTTKNHIHCSKCMENYIQFKKEELSNKLLKFTLDQTIPLAEKNWSKDDYVPIYNKKILRRHIDISLLKNDPLFQRLYKGTYIHLIKIKKSMTEREYKEKVCGLKGSVLPPDMDKYKVENNILSFPDDDIKGLIIFENTNDFVLIDKVPNSLEDIINFSKSEMSSISNLTLGARSGAAGGFVHEGSNSHSLSKVTQKENSILVASENSVSMSCFYDNNEGVTKKFNSVYNDIHMNRLNGKDKFKQLSKLKCYRNITIHEMTSRLQSFIISTQLKLNCPKYGSPFKTFNTILQHHASNKLVKQFMNM